MESNPLVSITIPTYNRECYICQAIDSCINQTYKNIEIIICDNCSTDNTWKILNEYKNKDKRIKIYRNETNLGPVLNWKECFKRVSGEYIKILWSDDWMDSCFIQEGLNLFDKNTAFIISPYTITNQVGEKIETIKLNKSIYSKFEYLNNMLILNKEKFPVSPGCSLFRTKDILKGLIINIPNTDNFDSKNNGAGNDVLIFLNTVINYKYIKILTSSHSYFRAHNTSFTCCNNLDKYYDWSYSYFVKKNSSKIYENILKLKFLNKSYKDKSFTNLYRSLNYNLWFIISALLLFYYKILKFK